MKWKATWICENRRDLAGQENRYLVDESPFGERAERIQHFNKVSMRQRTQTSNLSDVELHFKLNEPIIGEIVLN